jgi:Flp pilus assembly protein TadD
VGAEVARPGESKTAALDGSAEDRAGKLVRVAEKALEAGDVVSALRMYQRAFEADPSNVAPLVAGADILLAAGRLEEAQQALALALARDPANAQVHAGLGALRLQLGDYDAARESYRTALAAGFKEAHVFNGLALALDLSGRHAEAQAVYHEGLALYPDHLALLNNFGLSLALTDDLRGARDALSKVAESPFAEPRHRQNLALVLGLLGETEDARRLALRDLPPEAAEANLAYYTRLRANPRREAIAEALGLPVPSSPPSFPSSDRAPADVAASEPPPHDTTRAAVTPASPRLIPDPPPPIRKPVPPVVAAPAPRDEPIPERSEDDVARSKAPPPAVPSSDETPPDPDIEANVQPQEKADEKPQDAAVSPYSLSI